jgi:hypothetical protein
VVVVVVVVVVVMMMMMTTTQCQHYRSEKSVKTCDSNVCTVKFTIGFLLETHW